MGKKGSFDIPVDAYKRINLINELLIAWVLLLENGVEIKEWLFKRGYKRVAIYGLDDLGQLLLRELRRTGVDVLYGVDNRADDIPLNDIEIVTPDSISTEADAMIVTAVYTFQNVNSSLQDRVSFPIISLENIIFDMACEL